VCLNFAVTERKRAIPGRALRDAKKANDQAANENKPPTPEDMIKQVSNGNFCFLIQKTTSALILRANCAVWKALRERCQRSLKKEFSTNFP
jgi:hypothetical protein